MYIGIPGFRFVKLKLKCPQLSRSHVEKVFTYCYFRTHSRNQETYGMKVFVLTFVVLGLQLFIGDQSIDHFYNFSSEQGEKVIWRDWEDFVEADLGRDRKVVLKVYTKWCTWCQRMDSQTFSDPQIAAFLNEEFFPVKFDAETKKDIKYNGKTYSFVSTGKRGHHELAATLLRGRLSYPTIIFLDENGEYIQSIVGFKSPEEFEMILTYFYGDYHKTKPWSSFKRDYQSRLIMVKDE